MAHNIYRKESIERMSSPDRLDVYIHVTSPGLWLLFGAIIVLLLSALVWGMFGRITVTVDGLAIVDAGETYLLVPASKADAIEQGMSVRIGEVQGEVESLTDIRGIMPEISAKYGGEYAIDNPTMAYQTFRIRISNLSDGMYDASVIIESIRPFSFITN